MLRALHHIAAILVLAAGPIAVVAVARAAAGDAVRAPLVLVVVSCALCTLAVARLLWLWAKGRWQTTSLAPFRLALALGVGAWVVLVSVVHPFDPKAFATTLTVAVALLGTAVIFGDTIAPRVDPRVLRAADVVVFNLCAGVLTLELGLRAWAHLFPSQLVAQTDATVIETIAQSRFPPRMMYNGRPVDERGYNDDAPRPRGTGEPLVVSIGDSFSVGIVPHHFLYTTVAERLLAGTQIYSMGVNGCGPNEYLHMLRYEALALDPDAVVIALYIGNDLTDASRGQLPHRALRRWFNRDNLLLWQVPRRLLALAGEEGVQSLEERRILSPEEYASYREITLEDMLAGMPWLEDVAAERATHSPAGFLRMESWKAAEICGEDSAHAACCIAALDDMVATCRRARIRPFVVLIPDEFQVEDELWHEIVAGMPDRRLERDQPQKILGQWLATRGIAFLDLLAVLRAVPAMEDGKRHLYHLRDTHFNARGNRVAGQALAEFLRTRL